MQQTVQPPVTNGPKPPSRRSVRQVLATRRGMLGLAAIVAMLGAGAILVFLQQYRDSVADETRPVTVLVAKGPIGKGTAGEVVAGDILFQASQVPESDAKDGAFTDPGSLRGRVATKDVFPGEQLTADAFVVGSGSVESRIRKNDRAISVSVDAAHGLVDSVNAGDRVDVLAGLVVQSSGGQPRPVVRTLVQDVLVLDAPGKTDGATVGSAQTEEVVLRVSDRQALAVAFAADNGKVWVILRPPSNAEQSPPSLATPEALLTGVRPINLESRGGRR